jgi:hypothetical protein
MIRLLFDIWGICGITMAALCWYRASRHRLDGRRWGIDMVPIWKNRDQFDSLGYRYLWIGYSLLVAAILPDFLCRLLSR